MILNPRFLSALSFAIVLLVGIAIRGAEPHRATRLGDPATRFAPPLQRPEDLRRLLLDERLRDDVASILRQAGWRGDLEDLRRAAATAEITAMKLPRGARMPFMSSRRNGKPIVLRDVIWEGREPIEAFAFVFSSRGRRYHLITPRPCSNFYVVDLGPEPRPSLQLEKTAPMETGVCSPFDATLVVRNSGNAPATQVQVFDVLPQGLRAVGQPNPVSFDAGTLKPGESRSFRFAVMADAAGTYTNRARAISAERWGAEALAVTTVTAPRLTLACEAPATVLIGRPAEVCLTVRNEGRASDSRVAIALPVPSGTTVVSVDHGGAVVGHQIVWDVGELQVGGLRRVCATVSRSIPGEIALAPNARGACSPPVESRCAALVSGVSAVLLEVVDLQDPVEVGSQVTYEIRVTNQGSASLSNLRFAGTLPESQEFVSGSGATAVEAQERSISSAALPSLAPKAQTMWRVSARALGVDDARFKVELTGDQFPRPVEEWEATTQY